MRAFLFLAALVAASALAATTTFTADVVISGDPNVWGVMSGVMNYTYASLHRMSILYTWPNGTQVGEYIDYDNDTRYLHCSACFAATYKNTPDEYYPKSTDVATGNSVTLNGLTCLEYSRASANLSVWATTNSMSGTMCKIVYLTGKTITFSNFRNTDIALQWPVVTSSGWNCPARVCNQIMDLVIVLDESGSITADSWNNATSFATTLLSKFTLSTSGVMAGVVFFDTTARIISNLDASYTNLYNAIMGVTQDKGWTCMGCGVYDAIDVFNSASTTRQALRPQRVMMFVTDGDNNHPTSLSGYSGKQPWNYYLNQSMVALKALSPLRFVIPVNMSASRQEFQIIATSSSYIYSVSSYAALAAVIDKLVTATCNDFPDEPCGSSCKGFCSCGGACSCPTGCVQQNGCDNSTCAVGSFFSGCHTVERDCTDNKLCTLDYCDRNQTLFANQVCRNVLRVASQYCDDSNPCTDDLCNNLTGCYHQDHTCTSIDKCHNATCNKHITSGDPCVQNNISCSDGIACTADECDGSLGCLNPLAASCTGTSKCYTYGCDRSSGLCTKTNVTCTSTDPCKIPRCEPATGCLTSPNTCNDNNPCTNDYCNSSIAGGCVHVNISNCDAKLCTDFETASGTCASKAATLCQVGVCAVNTTAAVPYAYCKFHDKTAPGGECYTGDGCYIPSCDTTTGVCSYTDHYTGCYNYSLADKMCMYGSCAATGVTSYQCVSGAGLKPCPTIDACHVGYCVSNLTGACAIKSPCPARVNCTTMTCTITAGGDADCQSQAVTCSAPACFTSSCVTAVDGCVTTAIPVPAHSFCEIPYCGTTGWATTPNLCDDGDNCTVDTCYNESCHHSNKCDDGLYCTQDLCTYDSTLHYATCYNPSIVCNLNLTTTETACYKAVCTEVGKCHKLVIKGAFSNPCGKCVSTFSPAAKDTSCIGSLTWKKAGAAIAGGVIAGIVIAAIIGFLAFSAASAFGTWKLVQMAKAGKGMSAHNNPMYKPSDSESVNPAYKS